MPKQKDRPEASNGGSGGANPHEGYARRQNPPSHSPTPMAAVTPSPQSDTPQGHPPGFSAAPGKFITHVSTVGWHAPGFPPPPAGSTAQSAFNLLPPLPIGTKATHFSGPLVSGGIPQVPAWTAPHGGQMLTDPIGGTPLLTTYLTLDYSQGNFTVPVQFPEDSLVIGIASASAIAFTAAPSFQIGSTSGASDIASGSMPAPGAPLSFLTASGQLPLWNAVAPQSPFMAYLTVAGNTGGTAGLGFILVQFVRIPQRWT